ncbi:hypothetical protein V8E53_004485 [Lactarius tabidus]
MVNCRGCGREGLKRSGVIQHCRMSQDPRCQAYLNQLKSAKRARVRTIINRRDEMPFSLTTNIPGQSARSIQVAVEASAVSHAAVEASSESLAEERTVQMTFVDHVSDPDNLITANPAITPEDQMSAVSGPDNDNDDDNSDTDAAHLAEYENGLEPHRQSRPLSPMADPGADLTTPGEDIHCEDKANAPDNSTLEDRREAELVLERRPFVTKYPGHMAGAVHSKANLGENQKYGLRIGKESQENLYAPFTSQLEWELARWAKIRGPSLTSFTELMAIEGVPERLELSFKNAQELNEIIDTHLPGRPSFQRKEILVGDEVCELYFRDIIQCIRTLFFDPDFAPYLIFTPEKHYADEEKTERMYHDMHTGSWWWSTQAAVEKDMPGATIAPVLISTDKTQLTSFRNKSAYPIYMTIGNIPKELRRKTSLHAYLLLGYLPTTKLEQEMNKAKRKRLTTNLYHACLRFILQPLAAAGNEGVFMSTATGDVHRVHPVIASFIGDYPEQVLTTCSIYSDCPRCGTTKGNMGDFDPNNVCAPRNLDEFLDVLDSFRLDPAGFLQAASHIRAKPVPLPFWLGLPHLNIFRSITPDILHQLYQGVIKYLKAWVTSACGATEIDARCRRLPPNHNIRLFMKGISSLSRVTGHEHDQMCRFLLGIIIDVRLPNNLLNVRLIRSTRALLDFLYLVQYPIHSDSTLRLLMDALNRFHANKGIFLDLGIRTQFDIPKIHFLSHYVELIKHSRTADNFDTQYTERLHIDLPKKSYAATNHKDEYEQMTTWTDRRERVLRHEQYIKWRQGGARNSTRVDLEPPNLDTHSELSMAKHPSLAAVPLERLQDSYGAPLFKVALRRFISFANNRNQTRQQLESSLWRIHLPFTRLPVWHVIKFTRPNTSPASPGARSIVSDSIHVQPARYDKRQRLIPGRFDTALINDGTGVEHGIKGYHIGRIRVVFAIPSRYHHLLFDPGVTVPQHLAYVQWYSQLTEPEPNHRLFKIRPLKDLDGNWICSIIPVGNIRRSVHLIPKFGPVAPAEWTSSNVLDSCNVFYLNTFSDRHIFRTTTL